MVGEIRSRLGPLSILCCFAGIVNCVFAEDMPADQWRKVLDVNTTGTWLVTQAVGKWVHKVFLFIITPLLAQRML